MLSCSCSISNLPEEVLEIILAKVKSTVAAEVWWASPMRTCPLWHRIGLSLHTSLGFAVSTILECDTRRRDVSEENPLSKHVLVTDFELRTPSDLFVWQLRSLTLHVRHQQIAAEPFHPRPEVDMIEHLRVSFRTMTRLTIFSLKFSDGWDFPTLDVPVIPQSMLADLVEALPETIVDRKLDTAGIDIPPSSDFIKERPASHLCYQLNNILYRLQHLRLRTGHICAGLLNLKRNTPSCPHASTCGHCRINETSECQLIRSWTMRTMTDWLS